MRARWWYPAKHDVAFTGLIAGKPACMVGLEGRKEGQSRLLTVDAVQTVGDFAPPPFTPKRR